LAKPGEKAVKLRTLVDAVLVVAKHDHDTTGPRVQSGSPAGKLTSPEEKAPLAGLASSEASLLGESLEASNEAKPLY
jgi:hypothetical protein